MHDFSATSFKMRLDQVIEKNLHDEDFSIEQLCRELTISYTHTYRKIREELQLSPSRYVSQKRLERACQLLATTEMRMRDIAYAVGFNTQAYFSRCFSEVYGCSPLRYKKQLNVFYRHVRKLR